MCNSFRKKPFLFSAFTICVLIGFGFLAKKEKLFPSTYYSSVLLDCQNELLCAQIAKDGQWRFPPVDSVPKKYATCIKLFEDEYFNYHLGFNPISLLRALWQNLKAGKTISGGSTITMQVIRLSTQMRAQHIGQKIWQILLAFRLELHYSKTEILNAHASHAPFGGNVVGIEAAAWRYYGRNISNLSWAEYATLAVLPNAPSLIHPGRNQDLLKNKRDWLLDKLYKKGYITEETCYLAKLEELPTEPKSLPQNAMHLLHTTVKSNEQGQRISSTLDKNLQQKSQTILNRFLAQYAGNQIFNGAILVAEIESGNVRAYIGNGSINSLNDNGNWNDMVVTERSTGSVLKPFLYGVMLNEGQILPNSLVEDVPTFLSGYAPKNYSQTFDGLVPASQALSRSLNVPAVRMLKEYSYQKFHSNLKKLGMQTLHFPPSHYGLTMILGGAEGTLYDLCGMYASLGRTLKHFGSDNAKYRSNDIRVLNFLANTNGQEYQLSNASVIDAGAIWQMFSAMEEVSRPENQLGWQRFETAHKVAWKTGTSFGYRDAWAIGVDGDYVVGVWIGNADGTGRDGLVGVKLAAPVMFDIFNLLPNTAWFQTPFDDLKKVVVCHQSGLPASDFCGQKDTVLVPNVDWQLGPCPYHKLISLSLDHKWQVNNDCENIDQIQRVSWFVLPPVAEYYFQKKYVWYKHLPPMRPDCNNGEIVHKAMSFIYPENFSRVKIPRELDGKKGNVVIQLAHREPKTRVFWYLDGQFLGETCNFHEQGIQPSVGTHKLTLVDENGETVERILTIVE